MAEAGTCSGDAGPDRVEVGTTFQKGTEVGFLKWGGGSWLAPSFRRCEGLTSSPLSSHLTRSFASPDPASIPQSASFLHFLGESLHCETLGRYVLLRLTDWQTL